MELRQLEYFNAVAEQANFTKAAEALHVSQPAITTAVKNLENELGVLLFVRDKRRVLLTFEGELFLGYSRQLVQKAAEAVQKVRQLSKEDDRILRIGLAPVSGAKLAAALHGGFSHMYPDVRFQLLEMGSLGIMEAIDRDEIDVGYTVIMEAVREKYAVSPVDAGCIHAVLSKEHPLAGRKQLTVEELAQEPIISLPPHTYVSRMVGQAFREKGITPNIISSPQQMFTVFNIVAHGAGICFALGSSYADEGNAGGICCVPLVPAIPYEIGFVWKKERRLNSAAKQCIRFMQGQQDAEKRPYCQKKPK